MGQNTDKTVETSKLTHDQNEVLLSKKHKINGLEDKCHSIEHQLSENRDALVLYCQQFSFATEMVRPCADVLTCRDRQLHYDFFAHH